MLVPRSPERVSQIGVELQQDMLASPTTSAVIGAFVDEALTGVGTLQADIEAGRVEEAGGRELTIDEYAESPYMRKGVPYYGGMTEGAAEILARRYDEKAEQREILSKASTAQTVAGFGAAFAAGIFEPKNLVAGVAVSAASGGLGVLATGANSARRLLQINRQTARYKTLATRGFGEGLVAAAILEPSNRKSAKVLQEEYTAADSLWNIGLSAALGAGINVAPKFIADKWSAHKTRTADIVATELDAAMGQLSTGKAVDVRFVEALATQETIARAINARDSFALMRDTREALPQISRLVETADLEASMASLDAVQQEIAAIASERNTAANQIDPEVRRFNDDIRSRLGSKDITPEERASLLEELQTQERIARQSISPENKAIVDNANTRLQALRPKEQEAMTEVRRQLGHVQNDLTTMVNKAVKKANDPLESTAYDRQDLSSLKEINSQLIEKHSVSTYKKSFDESMQKLKDMVDEGVIDADYYDTVVSALSKDKSAETITALERLEMCLTRG